MLWVRDREGMTQDIPAGWTVVCDTHCPNTPTLISQHPNTSESLALLWLHKASGLFLKRTQSCSHDAGSAHSAWDAAASTEHRVSQCATISYSWQHPSPPRWPPNPQSRHVVGYVKFLCSSCSRQNSGSRTVGCRNNIPPNKPHKSPQLHSSLLWIHAGFDTAYDSIYSVSVIAAFQLCSVRIWTSRSRSHSHSSDHQPERKTHVD